MQLTDAQTVQIFAALAQVGVVLLPCLDRILIDTGGGQNRLPQLFHCLALRQTREHLLRPCHTGHCGNAPLLLAVPTVNIGLDDGIGQLAGFCHLGGVDTLQTVRILGNQIQPARQGIAVILLTRLLPLRHRAQRLNRLIAHMDLL